ISREGFKMDVYKSIGEGEFISPYTSVTIRNFVDEDGAENEDDIKEQTFELAGGHPLKVITHKYGEETQEGTTTLATEDQTTYIKTVLEEVA
ncbi:MAG TPA: hypothetical protein VF810_03925, partial [Patescibacteria group bacterium]